MKSLRFRHRAASALAVATLTLHAAPAAASRGSWTTPVQSRQDTIQARVDLVIGEDAVPAPGRLAGKHIFGAISGIAVDRQGRIYATDLQQTHVAVFSPAGALLSTIGRKGQGPGEFQGPSGPAIAPDGALYVRDVAKVTKFVTDPNTGLATKYERAFRGPIYPNWTSRRASRVDRQGRFHHPGSIWRTGEPLKQHTLMYRAGGEFVDTLPVPQYDNQPEPTASVMMSPNSGRMVRGLNHVPFAPLPVWDVTPMATVISGDARSYLLVETDRTGQILRRFERIAQAARIPASERDDSLKALERRIDSLPIPITRPEVRGIPDDVKAKRLPATLPSYIGVFVVEDGRVWVRRWPPPGRRNETFFDVFDPSARFLGTVVLPIRLAGVHHPVIGTDVLVGVTVDEETDLESIVRARFQIP